MPDNYDDHKNNRHHDAKQRLEALFALSLQDNSADKADDCPDPETIARYFDERLSKKVSGSNAIRAANWSLEPAHGQCL